MNTNLSQFSVSSVPDNGLESFCHTVAANKKLIAKYWRAFYDRGFVQTVEYHQSDFRNDIGTQEEVKSTLGRKWKTNLLRLRPLAYWLMRTTSRDMIVEKPISTRNETLLSYMGNFVTINRAIADLLKLDVLKLTTPVDAQHGCYTFGNANRKKNKCYTYIINRRALETVWDTCKANLPVLVLNEGDKALKTASKIDGVKKAVDEKTVQSYVSKCGFTSKRKVAVVENIEDILFAAQLKRYPQLEHYMILRDRLNEYDGLPYRAKGKYNPNYTVSGSGQYVTGIAIRDTNSICNLKVHRNANPDYKGEWRDNVLKSIWNTNRVFEFDVKASVPRVLWFLKYGEWLPQDFDLYELINGAKFSTPLARSNCKEFVLRMVFTSSAETLFRNIYPAVEGLYKDSLEMKKYTKHFIGPDDYCVRMMERFNSIFGTSVDSEVFFHESNIYMDVEKEIQKHGLPYVKVYDAFFSPDKSIMELEPILVEVANRYYESYLK